MSGRVAKAVLRGGRRSADGRGNALLSIFASSRVPTRNYRHTISNFTNLCFPSIRAYATKESAQAAMIQWARNQSTKKDADGSAESEEGEGLLYGGFFGDLPFQETSMFQLPSEFLEEYKTKTPPFGFNGLGQVVYYRTYARPIKDESGVERLERWYEACQRVVEGTFEIQMLYETKILKHKWDPRKAQAQAQDMYARMFDMRFLPPGRGLWTMGTALLRKKNVAAALNNCAFVSTQHLGVEGEKPFVFLMDASMVGVGVGFDTLGAGQLNVKGPSNEPPKMHVVKDSREGWVEATGELLRSYFNGTTPVEFDYTKIRPAGTPLKTFGGLCSGYEPLLVLHDSIRKALNLRIGHCIGVRGIVDIMNMIGCCVVSGNVRRSAEIAFGGAEDEHFLDLKDYEKHPERMEFGWASNNSIFARRGMNYTPVANRIMRNGEPGLAWLGNMREFGRLGDPPNNSDRFVMGGNPCLEQSLEDGELCCLVETFPTKHASKEDFLETLKCAHLYAKTVTLMPTHWQSTNEIIYRNRRIGCSVSGVAQFITTWGLDELRDWLDEGYATLRASDRMLSHRWEVNTSVKLTSVKPSGTISLLAGVTPGMHYPESRFYIRRLRLAASHSLVPILKAHGHPVEPCKNSRDTVVVEFPIDAGAGIRSLDEISMWEQLSLAAFLQKFWADNQVSATVTFTNEESSQLAPALDYFQYQLKGVSFLPRAPTHPYPQMPYEACTQEAFTTALGKLQAVPDDLLSSSIAIKDTEKDASPDAWCDSGSCTLGDRPPAATEEIAQPIHVATEEIAKPL